jgi:hypothetical protein
MHNPSIHMHNPSIHKNIFFLAVILANRKRV